MDLFEVVDFFGVFVLADLVDMDVLASSDFHNTENVFANRDVLIFEWDGVIVGELVEEFSECEEFLDEELELFSDCEGLAEYITLLVLGVG